MFHEPIECHCVAGPANSPPGEPIDLVDHDAVDPAGLDETPQFPWPLWLPVMVWLTIGVCVLTLGGFLLAYCFAEKTLNVLPGLWIIGMVGLFFALTGLA